MDMTPPFRSYAMVDVESVDLRRFPALARARGLETTLEPGEVLWLPSYYYHHVRQLDSGNKAVHSLTPIVTY